MDDDARKKILARMKEGGGFLSQTFGIPDKSSEEDEIVDVSEKDYHIERFKRQSAEAQLEALQARLADQQAHIATLEKTLDAYQATIENLHRADRSRVNPGGTGFAAWATPAGAMPDYEAAKSSVNALKEADNYVRDLNEKMARDRALHSDYHHWLWMTKATDVSFEDWKAGRYVVIT